MSVVLSSLSRRARFAAGGLLWLRLLNFSVLILRYSGVDERHLKIQDAASSSIMLMRGHKIPVEIRRHFLVVKGSGPLIVGRRSSDQLRRGGVGPVTATSNTCQRAGGAELIVVGHPRQAIS